jgi:hypothetical protein
MESMRVPLLLGVAVIVAIVIGVARQGDSYAQQAAAACSASYENAGILAADAELARSGRVSVDRLPVVGTRVLAQNDFPRLRSLEAAQKRRFEAIGVEDCSN